MIEPFERLRPVVSPTAFVHDLAAVIGDVTLGDAVTVWPGASLRGDHGAIRIGPRTSIQDGAVAHGTERISEVDVGADCTVGHRAILHGCTVADHVLVGMGAILLDNCELGEWTIVGAGSLVTARKKFPPGVMILGSPAKVVRDLTDDERRWIEYSWKAYVDFGARFLAERARRG
jgi:carbonic anhydrase/acetyltransferase-like protein (isoleucine patch superfamily)